MQTQPSAPAPQGPVNGQGNADPNKKGQPGSSSLLEVRTFDMTEDEVRIWDTRVGMAVGLLLLIAGGSLLVFGTIKLINWLSS